MKQSKLWLSLGQILTLGCLLGMLGFSIWDKPPTPVEPIAWSSEAQWIGPAEPSYRLYARHNFYLGNSQVRSGWLRVSADNNFIMYLNGRPIGRQLGHTSSALSFTTRNTFGHQNVNDSKHYTVRSKNINIGYPQHWKLTYYIDLTRQFLRPGKNAIAIEVQKATENPRVVVEGKINPVAGKPVDLTTGATAWQVSTLSENQQALQWWEADFNDKSWAKAKNLGPVQETTYSRLSQEIFSRPLQGNWITGPESSRGELWLRGNWKLPAKGKRAYIRFAANSDYSVTINGHLIKWFVPKGKSRKQLHIYEVTPWLKTGDNTVTVRLARPLSQGRSDGRSRPIIFLLDGWVETGKQIAAPIATDSTWEAFNQPISGDREGVPGQTVTVLGPPDPQEFQRNFEGNAYLLDYPDYLLHQTLWQVGGMVCALIYAVLLGRFWGDRPEVKNRVSGVWSWAGPVVRSPQTPLKKGGFKSPPFCKGGFGGDPYATNADYGVSGLSESINTGAALLLPGTLFVIGMGLLKHRYAESEKGLLFAQTQSNAMILLGFVGIVLLTFIWSLVAGRKTILERSGLWFLLGSIAWVGLALTAESPLIVLVVGAIALALALAWGGRSRLGAAYRKLKESWWKWGKWCLFIAIIAMGLGLRVYDIGFTARDSDENTSLDAIAGILRTGAPVATSGIWYSRGAFYHYTVALWLRLVGFSDVNGRLFSALVGTGTLIGIFFLTRKITGKFWIALVVTAILAIDPWELMYSRNIRFYPLLQFTTTVAFLCFCKGAVYREGKGYQYGYIIAMTCSLLTQEGVSLMQMPVFFLGALYFYRPWRWGRDWWLLPTSFVIMLIYGFNGVFFLIKCLTASVGLSGGTATQLKFQLSDLTGFTMAFFVGNSRLYVLYSFFFILGFIYAIARREGKLLFLYSSIFLVLITMTCMILQVSPGYAYAIYPLFVMLSVYGAFRVMNYLGRKMEFCLDRRLPLGAIAWVSGVLLLLVNLEPMNVMASYQEALSRDNPAVFEYIRTHRQPGDVVMANLPSAAAIALNELDYFLPRYGILGFDRVYSKEGRLIERHAGGVPVTNLDRLNQILAESNRVWIQLDDNPPPKQPEVSAFYHYVRTLGKPIFEPYGVRLRLWEREDGLLPRVPNQGKDIGNY